MEPQNKVFFAYYVVHTNILFEFKSSYIPYSGKVWRALNLANWLLEGIGEIGDLDS